MITYYLVHHTDIFWFVASVLELSLFFIFIRKLERRTMSLWVSIIGAVVLFSFWWVIHLAHFDFIFDFIANLVVLTVYLVFTNKVDAGQSIYVASIYLLCTETGKIVTVDFVMQPMYDKLVVLSEYTISSIWVVLFLVFTALALLIVTRWVFKTSEGQLSWKQSLIVLLPLAPYAYLRTSGYAFEISNPLLYRDVIVVLFLLIVATITVLVANAHSLSSQIERNELLHMQSLLREQNLQYLAQKTAAEAVNQKYHDLKHFIFKLEKKRGVGQALLPDDYSEFIDYVNKELSSFEADVETGNETLDVLLTGKKRICQEKGIQPVFYADGAKLSFLSSFDLCAIVGNALDNAIEAVEKNESPEARIIDLTITYSNGLAVLQCKNRYSGRIRNNSDTLLTSKDDGENHGFGVKSIRAIAEKYNGYSTWSISDDEFTLTVMIPIPEK